MGGMRMEEGRDLLEKTLENDRVPSKMKSALLELYSNYREIVLDQPNADQLLKLFTLFPCSSEWPSDRWSLDVPQ
jgi:hypothetical protein